MDIFFYKNFYDDLSLLNDNDLIDHYNKYGKNECRLSSEKDFINRFPEFNINIYKFLNNDLQNMNNIELMKHYFLYGINENRIASIHNFYIYKKINFQRLQNLYSDFNSSEEKLILKYLNVSKKKVAIIFYGLSRSLNTTIHSFKNNLFNILIKNNIDYDIFIHTYKIHGRYTNMWSGESIENYINEDIETILNPKYYLYDDQNNIEKILNIENYYTYLTWGVFGDPKLVKHLIKNYVLALYSKNKITQLFNQNIKEYDYAIICRPDMNILNEFDINYFNELNNNNIIIPEQDSYGGCNDRFCIGKPNIISLYGSLYNELLNYSKQKPIESELFLLDMLNKNNINIMKKNIKYNMIRTK